MYNWKDIVEKEGYKFISADTFTVKVQDSDGFVFKFKKQQFPRTKKSTRNCETPKEYFLFKIRDHPLFDFMDFTEFEFKGRFKKSVFRCKIHDRPVEMVPANLYTGQGCRYCGYEKLGESKTWTTDKFIVEAKKIHEDMYDYSESVYINSRENITIICSHHGRFLQMAGKHISGQGCPECAKYLYGYDRTAFLKRASKNMEGKALYYVLECFNEEERFLKVGITTKSVEERYRKKNSMPYDFTVRYIGEQEAGLIYDIEKEIFKTMFSNKYFPGIDFQGKTECIEISSLQHLREFLKQSGVVEIEASSEVFIKR